MATKKTHYINGNKFGKCECPAKWIEDYECWEIDENAIVGAFEDEDFYPNEKGELLAKITKKAELGEHALKVAIEALKQVRENICFEGCYEGDILKLAEKVLKDELRVNKYSYE